MYPNTQTCTHRSSFSMCHSRMARIHFHLIQHCPLPGTVNLAWPETYVHSLSRRIPWPCGTCSHKKGPWWAAGSFKGLVGIGRLSQRWKGPGSLRASELHKDMSTSWGWGGQDSGSFQICAEISSHLALIADACQKSQGHTPCIPSQPGDSNKACQVALNKYKIRAAKF